MAVTPVTGGSRDIGADTAVQCARRGMGVILTCNTHSETAEAVVRRI